MKIFGMELKTKNALKTELAKVRESFPFDIGQVVYDIQLKNSRSRFTKTNPSFEHSVINEVVVDTKNYFNLVERFENNDVFTSYDDAVMYLHLLCE